MVEHAAYLMEPNDIAIIWENEMHMICLESEKNERIVIGFSNEFFWITVV